MLRMERRLLIRPVIERAAVSCLCNTTKQKQNTSRYPVSMRLNSYGTDPTNSSNPTHAYILRRTPQATIERNPTTEPRAHSPPPPDRSGQVALDESHNLQRSHGGQALTRREPRSRCEGVGIQCARCQGLPDRQLGRRKAVGEAADPHFLRPETRIRIHKRESTMRA